MNNKAKVNFDPGFAAFSTVFPTEIPFLLNTIAKLKQPHQKKFEFQKLEMRLLPLVKNCAAVYLGCILWGSYLYWRYRDNPAEISGNVIKKMSEEEKKSIDYSIEMDFILKSIEDINKASLYYLKRPTRIDRNLFHYFEEYREFATLNNNFKELNTTCEIKLPKSVAYFENYDNQKLDELKNIIKEIINSGKIEKILDIKLNYSDF